MSELEIDQEAEEIVRALASDATEPHPGECLACHVARMLEDFGCDCTLRFARHYRDLRAPRASDLERRGVRRGSTQPCTLWASQRW